MKNLFTIDVEDWFHIMNVPSTPSPENWDRLPSRIETNFFLLLDLLSEYHVRATCFFLGWTAGSHPNLIQEAARRGHEIGSHGCWHQLIYQMNAHEFIQDILEARRRIEDACGFPICSYRAPGFSLTDQTPFFFDALREANYENDSSIFPCSREHGGIRYNLYHPHRIGASQGSIYEFPISTTTFLGQRYCFSGGGYFRLFPYSWIASQIRKANKQGYPVIIYIHPRDIDLDQPRMSMNWRRRFKSYYGLAQTERKLIRLFKDFEFTSLAEFRKDSSNRHFFEHDRKQPFTNHPATIR